MRLTREEFVRKWKCHVAGMALFGVASEVKDGLLTRTHKILEIPGEVERLLARMWDDLAKDDRALAVKVEGNGQKKVGG